MPLVSLRYFKVCSDAKESGVRKATVSYYAYLSLVKLQPWFLSLQWNISLCVHLKFKISGLTCFSLDLSIMNALIYNRIPRTRSRQLLREYYEKIWNETYTNSNKDLQTKKFIPTIYHRTSLSLWPKHIITQFLTNHGRFRSYLHRMNEPSTITQETTYRRHATSWQNEPFSPGIDHLFCIPPPHSRGSWSNISTPQIWSASYGQFTVNYNNKSNKQICNYPVI